MDLSRWWAGAHLLLLSILAGGAIQATLTRARAQETAPETRSLPLAATTSPVSFTPPAPSSCDLPLPINLPTALRLANVRAIDIAVASERIRLAAAQLERAQVLWLPNLQFGVDYFRHDGRIQTVEGNIIDTSKQAFMVGGAPTAVFAVTDAIFGPLAARQVLRARDADLQTATNDSMLAVAEAYLNVQQAVGELSGAEDAVRNAEKLLETTERVVRQGYAPPVEITRARTALAALRQTVFRARDRWRVASADLARLLRLDPAVLLVPAEPPQLTVTLVPLGPPVDELIPVALANRPELAGQRALAEAQQRRVQQERARPFLPSVLLRGAATNPAGTLAAGEFGGGLNDTMGRFGSRSDFDVQLLWELQSLGFGNLARVSETRAEQRLAVLELSRTQDRVAAEVVQAYYLARSASDRVKLAEGELRDALLLVQDNLKGLPQPLRTTGNVSGLVIRPQEVAAAIQAMLQANTDYYSAIADYDRQQFRLYHALGHPAQMLSEEGLPCSEPAAPPSATSAPPAASR